MMQTGGGKNPQQTHNSFGISNVTTNRVYSNAKSYSASKQLQSTNTTGYNFTGGGTSHNAYSNVQQHRTLRGVQGTPSNSGPVKATLLPQSEFNMTTI